MKTPIFNKRMSFSPTCTMCTLLLSCDIYRVPELGIMEKKMETTRDYIEVI